MVDKPSKWLQSPAYVPGLMPPQRREWSTRFIERTYAFVSDPDRTNEARPTQLKSLEFVIKDMLRRGVVVELLSIMCMAHDPDGKEERRGWHYGAQSSLELIATEDLREILMDAIEATADHKWIWSSGDHYDDFSTGAHAAVTALGKIGHAAFGALPAIRKLIAEEELERQTLVSGDVLEANPWVERRLARLFDAVQRIEQST